MKSMDELNSRLDTDKARIREMDRRSGEKPMRTQYRETENRKQEKEHNRQGGASESLLYF